METSTVSLRSISTTLIEPEPVMLVLASSMIVVSFPSLITGESLLPVMVSVIGVVLDAEDSDPDAPLSSVKVTVYVRTRVSPSCRKSNAESPESPEVKVQLMDEPDAAVSASTDSMI